MKCFIPLAFCLGIAAAWPAKTDPLEEPSWKAWKSFHGKSYGDVGEERVRNFIWKDNLKKINAHNYDQTHNYKLAMNHLGDLVRLKADVYFIFIFFQNFFLSLKVCPSINNLRKKKTQSTTRSIPKSNFTELPIH